MEHSITELSPRTTPSPRRKLRCSSPMMLRTPRSEGFLRQKVILDTPTSSEYSFSKQTPDDNTGVTPKPSLDENGSKEKVIPERKFYSAKKANLLPLFMKSQSELVKEKDTNGQRIDNKTPKRKRSKSVDYRTRNKIVKLSKNVRHGVKRPKPKKTPSKEMSSKKNPVSNAAPETLQFTEPMTSQTSEDPESELGCHAISPSQVVRKDKKKEISAKVNKLVRMKLHCGEIKFTKSVISPKKIPRKNSSETFDVLGVPENEDWLKHKVDNILNSLDDEDEMQTSLGQERSHDGESFSLKLNDSMDPLSNAFHVLGVRELVAGNVIQDSDEDVDSSNSSSFKGLYEKNRESLLLFGDPMEVADGDIPCHDVLMEKTVNSDEGKFLTPNKKLFPVFYKSPRGNSKENLVNGEKSVREGSKFTPRKVNDGMEQLIIDAGQKSLAPTTCPECGFFYNKGDADEEKMHKMYHGSAKPGIKHLGWKWERVAVKYPEGRVIRVCEGDPKTWWAKVDHVLEKANDDLGITFSSKLPKNAQAYMFVGDGYILGCVIAEPIRVAYKMLECDRKEVEKVEVDENKSIEMPKVPSFCSNTPVRGGRCGINRMWTCASERRKGIATKILDAIRATFVYGRILRLDEFAFSDPTPLGMSLAQKYTKTANILVYKPTSD